MIPARTLRGLRVMVLEDEMLISLMIEDMLADEHCLLVGPFDRIDKALRAVETEQIDLAVLDVSVAGSSGHRVAEALAERGIPFVFLSGYGEGAIPAEHPEWRVCSKPFKLEVLTAMLMEQVAARR